jgi:sulfur dioxygenase
MKQYSLEVKELRQILVGSPSAEWNMQEWSVQVFVTDDNLCYLAVNHQHQEMICVDPVLQDVQAILQHCSLKKDYRFLAVIDTHTHADHLTGAKELAELLRSPLIMHENAASRRVDMRICRDMSWLTASGSMCFLEAPGHTSDGLLVIWGPFVFTGDTLLFSDTGRNDLPTGDAHAHYLTLEKMRNRLKPEQIILPGHDSKGGRASSWQYQLENNPSLLQSKEVFISEATAFDGPSPQALKSSLYYNFK